MYVKWDKWEFIDEKLFPWKRLTYSYKVGVFKYSGVNLHRLLNLGLFDYLPPVA